MWFGPPSASAPSRTTKSEIYSQPAATARTGQFTNHAYFEEPSYGPLTTTSEGTPEENTVTILAANFSRMPSSVVIRMIRPLVRASTDKKH